MWPAFQRGSVHMPDTIKPKLIMVLMIVYARVNLTNNKKYNYTDILLKQLIYNSMVKIDSGGRSHNRHKQTKKQLWC